MVRKGVCADLDPRLYAAMLAIGPLILFGDAIASIVRRKARDSTYLGSAAADETRIHVIETYKSFELAGQHAISLGKSRLWFPATALVLVCALFLVYDDDLPRCNTSAAQQGAPAG